MPLGILFWVLMVIWAVVGIWDSWPSDASGRFRFGGNLLLFVLLFVLGWKCFGFVVQG